MKFIQSLQFTDTDKLIELAQLIEAQTPFDGVFLGDRESLKLAVDGSLAHLKPWVPWAANEPTPLDQKVAWLRKCRGEFDLGLDYLFGVFSRDESEVIGGAGLPACGN